MKKVLTFASEFATMLAFFLVLFGYFIAFAPQY